MDKNNWIIIVKRIYWNTPAPFRLVYWPLEKILRLYNLFRPDQWILSGKEKSSNQELSIQYTGIKENRNYIAQLAFGDSYQKEYLGKKWLWAVFWKPRQNINGCELNIAEVSNPFRWLFKIRDSFYVPCWVRGEIEIPADIALFVRQNSSLASNLNKIRKNQFSYKVLTGNTNLRKFYYDMYFPYISKTHGDRAVVENYEGLKLKFGKCNLLIVENKGEDKAGLLFQQTKQSMRLLVLGVKDGNSEYVRDGAIMALYYYSICYAQQSGYQRVNLGGSRAFLNDGVLQYKKKWDYNLSKVVETGFEITAVSVTNGIKGFLINNPFIFSEKGILKGAVFSEGDQSLDKEHFARIYKKYYFKGVSDIVNFRFKERGYFKQNDSGSSCQ